MNRQKGLAPILIVILIAVAIGGYLIYQKQFRAVSAPQPQDKVVVRPSPTHTSTSVNEMDYWKIYTDPDKTFTFKYPPSYAIAGQTPKQVKIGLTGFSGHTFYLTVSTDTSSFTNNGLYKLCSQINQNNPSPCIDENSFGQKKAIDNIMLNNKTAVNFYLKENNNYVYHVVQTESEPKMELKMDVADDEGLIEKDFNKILSTFKFTQ